MFQGHGRELPPIGRQVLASTISRAGGLSEPGLQRNFSPKNEEADMDLNGPRLLGPGTSDRIGSPPPPKW